MSAIRRWLLACLVLLPLHADEKWVEVDSGPFRVYSAIGLAPAQIVLGQLEQFRQAFSVLTGKPDPTLVFPLSVVLEKPSRQAPPESFRFGLARNSLFTAVPPKPPLPAAFLMSLAALLEQDNLKRLPPAAESGLVALLSGFESQGTRITVNPPAAPLRTRDWARLFRLASDPATQGEVHVFLSNLEQGADMQNAFFNAYRQSAAAMEAALDAYFAAGNFSAFPISGRALSPTRDFHPIHLDSGDAAVLRADTLLASGSSGARAAYQPLHGPEALEGLGLALLASGDKAAARAPLEASVQANSHSARAWLELARLEDKPASRREHLLQAAHLNPRWAEPYVVLATLETSPAARVPWLQKAVALAPRDTAAWQSLAEAATEAGDLTAADKAWAGAGLAASSEAERQRIFQTREELRVRLADQAEAQRKQEAAARAQDLERVKAQTMAEIHAAEEKANRNLNPEGAAPHSAPVPYSSLDTSGPTAEGTLVSVECRGRTAVLVLRDDAGKESRFSVSDVSRLAVSGAGVTSLVCGPQKPPRRASVQYQRLSHPRPGTLGAAQAVDFP